MLDWTCFRLGRTGGPCVRSANPPLACLLDPATALARPPDFPASVQSLLYAFQQFLSTWLTSSKVNLLCIAAIGSAMICYSGIPRFPTCSISLSQIKRSGFGDRDVSPWLGTVYCCACTNHFNDLVDGRRYMKGIVLLSVVSHTSAQQQLGLVHFTPSLLRTHIFQHHVLHSLARRPCWLCQRCWLGFIFNTAPKPGYLRELHAETHLVCDVHLVPANLFYADRCKSTVHNNLWR